MSAHTNQNETRDAAFAEWMEDPDLPLPFKPMEREIAVEAPRRAFNAGWDARKKAFIIR